MYENCDTLGKKLLGRQEGNAESYVPIFEHHLWGEKKSWRQPSQAPGKNDNDYARNNASQTSQSSERNQLHKGRRDSSSKCDEKFAKSTESRKAAFNEGYYTTDPKSLEEAYRRREYLDTCLL